MSKTSSLLLFFLLFTAGTASASEAICEIQASGEAMRSMPCDFSAESDGSFSVQSLRKDGPLYDEILVVSLAMTGKNQGQVSAVTKNGINSRWGAVNRCLSDKACWNGEDFRICVRAK